MIVEATWVSRSVGEICHPKSTPASAVNSVSFPPLTNCVWRNAGPPFKLSDSFGLSMPGLGGLTEVFRGGGEEVGGPLAVKRFGVDELEVEAFPSVGASAAEPPVSEELVQRLDPPVSGVMDSPLVLLFAFFSWKWRKKLVQLMAVFGREGGLAKEMAGLLVDAQESGNAATATDNVNMMFCAHSSAYFTRSRCEQNQHVPMSAALDAPASWLVRRPSLLRCCSWAAWLAA